MLNRYVPVIKLVCLILAVLFCLQLVRIKAGRPVWMDANMAGVLKSPTTKASVATKTNVPPQNPNPNPDMEVPTNIQTRMNCIIQSEIFGPVPRPIPMGLIGIGGDDAIIRAPSGQTGLLRVGETLGGVKLLQIGTNRVLVEVDGKKTGINHF